MSGSRYIGLYPRAWRDRYGAELQAVLEMERMGVRTRLDLLRGALDAHLHPAPPSRVPVLAAVTASALAVVHAMALAAQPVATEWPGYQEEALPLIVATVAASIPALTGVWLKLGDADGVLGRAGLILAVTGHAAWLVALVAAATRLAYGPLTAVAATIAMIGTAMLGVALAGHGRAVLGVLVAAVAVAGVAPAFGWPAFALAWTAVAAAIVLDRPDAPVELGGANLA